MLAIHVYPAPQDGIEDYPSAHLLPERLASNVARSREALIRGDYEGALTGARRTVEGIFKTLVPHDPEIGRDRRTLHQLIQLAIQKVDLSEPLKELAVAVKDGGNLGAHFDEAVDPNEESARSALRLSERLLDFVIVLPEEVSKFRKNLENLARYDDRKDH
ncbi:DUF4145 domain-containing protein [Jannaschia sp. KMU-145]|uniref:DUF4145 domain-containing protein n=1 Tax=Jannaschia halovivens TaxID=3388667 RepID=UPI00396B0965